MGMPRFVLMSDDPEGDLVKLVKRELGVEIDPQECANFIRSYWGRLSLLAHQIHDGTACGKTEVQCHEP